MIVKKAPKKKELLGGKVETEELTDTNSRKGSRGASSSDMYKPDWGRELGK